jgi:hypothetical protein
VTAAGGFYYSRATFRLCSAVIKTQTFLSVCVFDKRARMGRISGDVAISSAVIMYLYYSRFFPRWGSVPIKKSTGDMYRFFSGGTLEFAVEIINSCDLTYCDAANGNRNRRFFHGASFYARTCYNSKGEDLAALSLECLMNQSGL